MLIALGNFTQIVWSSSERIGVGKDLHKDSKLILVCLYHPPGNLVSIKLLLLCSWCFQ
ncbi:unnamed protein product [Schistosoma curassoni]|uniref:SCP domain-containing protein n=1 Tax=Schistosoma curassoni TaxID=6186 RepID=A0A183JQN6_9TREM|nr:unnamed protein product [Schistosoma curassoni]